MINKCLFFLNDYNISKELRTATKCVLHSYNIYALCCLPQSAVCVHQPQMHTISFPGADPQILMSPGMESRPTLLEWNLFFHGFKTNNILKNENT